jgi:hypothetical protein
MAVVLFLIASMSGCESKEQTVRIVAEDFRFTPSEVHVSSAYPIRLLVVNEGRERHEFKTALLAHQIGMSSGPSSSLPSAAESESRGPRSAHSRRVSVLLREARPRGHERHHRCRVRMACV